MVKIAVRLLMVSVLLVFAAPVFSVTTAHAQDALGQATQVEKSSQKAAQEANDGDLGAARTDARFNN
jgi:type II secretory pathway pseudopilin PulG